MLSTRLVNRIEEHAEELTREVLGDLSRNSRTPAYHSLARDELHRRVYDVYRNLGRWLGQDSDDTIQTTYQELGGRRCAEGIPLDEVVYALILSKYHLRDYIRSSGIVDSAVDLYQEAELHIRVGRFFDKALYFTILGYEGEATARSRSPSSPVRR
jgi:hypothetical protein